METVVALSNEFNLKLLKAYRNDKKQGNILYSPFGIAAALAMLYRGARTRTKKEFENVLGVEGNDAIDKGFHILLNSLLQLPRNRDLNIANVIATDKSYKILKEYANFSIENYLTICKGLNFKHKAEEVQRELNQYIESSTSGKVKDLFTTDSINSEAKLVFASAAFFKGIWKEKFGHTNKKSFYTITGEERFVEMICKISRHNYCFVPNGFCVEIPYFGDKLSMFVLLPKERDGLALLEESITLANIEFEFRNMSRFDVRVTLPVFRLEESVPLKELLSKMGMNESFTQNADFSGIIGNQRKELFVSAALHKASVEVDEVGIEVPIYKDNSRGRSCAPSYFTFTVDHPFLFFIREVDTGLILFTGSVHSV